MRVSVSILFILIMLYIPITPYHISLRMSDKAPIVIHARHYGGSIGLRENSSRRIVLVVVNKDAFERYKSLIIKWFTSTEYQGFDLILEMREWIRNVNVLKEQLKSMYYSTGRLIGVLFICSNDLYKKAEIFFDDPSITEHEYPMDLWIMDLDGEYRDRDRDGAIDYVDEDSTMLPEIFVARITTTFGLDTVEHVLNKSLAILTGDMPLLKNASIFIDNDWAYFADYIEGWFSDFYNPIKIISDPEQTNVPEFYEMLKPASGLYFQAIHSSETTLYIATPTNSYLTVSSDTIATSEFCGGQLSILFSCSAANYEVDHYLAEAFLRGKTTLLVISSTKVGGFWYGQTLTDSISQNLTFGESFRNWYRNIITNYLLGYDPYYDPPWWLGMTMIGNPLISFNITTIPPIDTDNDNVFDSVEYWYGTDPYSNDTDGDGISDGMEILFQLDPLNGSDAYSDEDGDKLANIQEINVLTNIHSNDTDSDGIPDGWEVNNNLNPLKNDARLDPDRDGLQNIQEYEVGTDPHDGDTDNDGIPDGWEVNNDLNPLENDAHLDFDGDTLTNLEEYEARTDPWSNDTDGDGMPDGWEVDNNLNPLENDAYLDLDNDTLTNIREYLLGTDPHNADSDNDGVSDSDEVKYGTDPTDPRSYPFLIKYKYHITVAIVVILMIIIMVVILRKKKKKPFGIGLQNNNNDVRKLHDKTNYCS